MVKKLTKSKPAKAAGAQLSGSVRDSAQQIWQAGLGALSKAQAEGTKAIEALVKEGTTLQRKTQAAAEEKISEATSKMSNMATDITSKATGQWDKLESIFEDRVAKALNKLGVPSAKDINALVARIDELNKSVQKLSAKGASTPKAAVKPPPKVATKAAGKPTAKAPKVADSAAKPAVKPVAKRVAARKVKAVADTAQA